HVQSLASSCRRPRTIQLASYQQHSVRGTTPEEPTSSINLDNLSVAFLLCKLLQLLRSVEFSVVRDRVRQEQRVSSVILIQPLEQVWWSSLLKVVCVDAGLINKDV